MVSGGDGLVLALDQGSHASRAVLFDPAGNQVAEAHVAVATARDGPVRVEQDPEELTGSLRGAIEDVLDSRAGADVLAVGLATQRSTVVAWNRRTGQALHDAISWQDRRAGAWLERLAPLAGRVHEITGLPLSPHYGASKLRWYLEHVPAVQSAAGAGELALGPLSSFLACGLAEERPCVADPANASRTLLYDPETQQWSPELMRLFGIEPAWLPQCVPTRHPFGHIACAGLRVPLTTCTGDQSAAAFAFGRPDPATALLNVGTGAFLQRAVPAGAPLPGGILRSVLCVDADGAIASHEGTVNGAGSALDWLRERVALDVDRGLAALSSRAPLEGTVPVFVNGVGGLGAPFWLADFPTEFVGDGDDGARLAAVIESIVFLVCANLEALRSAAPLERIRISGGLARNDYLCRCLAAASRLPVERPARLEATARGVAWLAAGKPAAWQPVPVEQVFTPFAAPALEARHARWRAAMAQRGAA